MLDKYIVLNNGVKIPQFGLGTWFIDDDKAADAVKAAAEMGYRHIDTEKEWNTIINANRIMSVSLCKWNGYSPHMEQGFPGN